MQYQYTKRDIEMYKRRNQKLLMPTSIIDEVIIGKYQATETRLLEVKEMLTNQRCQVKKLIIRQN